MTTAPVPNAPASDSPTTAELAAFDAPTVPALATEQSLAVLDLPLTDEAVPEQPVMMLGLRDLLAASQPPAPPIWPVPWRVEDAAPWWQRAWAHAHGAWLGTALAALLVVGLLGAGMALRLAPPSGTTVTTAHPPTRTAPHPTATTTVRKNITTTPLMAAPAPTVHSTQQSPASHSGSSGHGHKHK
jgi:hypothetical protein